jgi:flagellar protein FlaG
VNDVIAVSGNPNAWPASKQVAGLSTGDIRVADSQGNGIGEKDALRQLTKDDVEKGIEDMNRALSMLNRSLKFTVHEETGKLMVQVIEKESNKVITEIPPQILLDIEARIEKFIGILFDKKI